MSEAHIVRDFMTAPATSLPRDASLLEALLTFRRTGFRHLPVVEDGRVVGIISERDVQRVSPSLFSTISPAEYNSVFEKTPLERVMTRDPLTVTPDTPMRKAAIILSKRKVGCLPVVHGGRLTGIITVIDLLNFLVLVLDDKAKMVG